MNSSSSRAVRPFLVTVSLFAAATVFLFLADGLRDRRLPAAAQAAPAGNGDVNGDGRIDLSDPIGLLSYLFQGGAPPVALSVEARTATVLVVRHAEKEATGADPHLTPEGVTRAAHLADILTRTTIDVVYSTKYNRTIETVTPAASARSLTVEALEDADIVTALKALAPGKTALVAGNSFNIPTIISGLGVSGVTVPGDEYDNLWVVP